MKKQFLTVLVVGLLTFGIAGTASAIPSMSFLIDGNTFTQPWSISNNSSASERIVRFQLDLSPVAMVFDTVDGGAPGNNTIGVPFTPSGGTDVLTGLNTPVSIADGASLLDISFSDFGVGETFSWDIDVDGASGSPISVYGDQLIGAISIIDFSDGQRLTGELFAVANNPDASMFAATGITPIDPVPEPATILLLGSGLAGLAFYRRKRK